MKVKTLVKKGVKDTTWLYQFIEGRIKDNATHRAICTDKMRWAIGKYARQLDYHISRYCIYQGLFYNDGKYAIEVIEENGKNILYIYNINKCIEKAIEDRINKFMETVKREQIPKAEVDAYLEYFKLDTRENYKPFRANFTSETGRKIMNETKDFTNLVEKYI